MLYQISMVLTKNVNGYFTSEMFDRLKTQQGPTNILDKTCPWAGGRKKALARQEDLVVHCIA